MWDYERDYEFYEWYIFQQNTRVYMVKNRIMQGGKGLTNKKVILHMQHTFLWISLPLFCTTTTWNFQKLLSYTFFWGNVVRVLVHFVFTAAHFHLALVTASISHFVAATKFSCCSSNKKCLHVGTYSQKRPHVSDHQVLAFWVVVYERSDCILSIVPRRSFEKIGEHWYRTIVFQTG